MVSQQTIDIVKQTVPVLVEHGETLTRHFYQRMFTHDPQVKAFFNQAHQHSGTQQRALAGAICAYAQHIDNPAALAGAVELIAQKHASLGIKAEHYPIVGKHLLASIREVLGEAATDEIINAWAEAYGVLADIFIQREAEVYAHHEAHHGWSGFKSFTVARKTQESDTITSFYLKPADGGALTPFEAGQYLTVRLPLPEGGTTMRNYSISSRPGADHYRISVKREEAGSPGAPYGYVSHHLHTQVEVGDTLEVGPPCGEFTLDLTASPDRPLVLLSGGVGITPMLSMLHAAIEHQPERDVRFIHGALSSQTHALREEVADLAARHAPLRVHVRYSDPLDDDREAGRCDSVGLIDAELIRTLVGTPDADFYFCGPKPFMEMVDRALAEWGVADANRRHEFFGPAQTLAAA